MTKPNVIETQITVRVKFRWQHKLLLEDISDAFMGHMKHCSFEIIDTKTGQHVKGESGPTTEYELGLEDKDGNKITTTPGINK